MISSLELLLYACIAVRTWANPLELLQSGEPYIGATLIHRRCEVLLQTDVSGHFLG